MDHGVKKLMNPGDIHKKQLNCVVIMFIERYFIGFYPYVDTKRVSNGTHR